MGLLTAWRFLTVIPLPGVAAVAAKDLGRSQVYFPVVGLILGGGAAGLDWLLGLVLPISLTSALIIAALVVATGALHLDGLMDTCDGLAPGRSPQERLAIMRDSRSGNFGVAGGVCLLLAKYGALSSLGGPARLWALTLAPVLGRWGMVYAILAYPYARDEGKGRIFKVEASLGRFVAATLLAATPVLGLLRVAGVVLLAGAGLVAVAVAGFLSWRFGDLTGDSYGAINEMVEVVALILLPLSLRLVEVTLG